MPRDASGRFLKDTDKGFNALFDRLKAAKALVLTVGVHAPEGAAQDGKLTVAQVATIHEYGLGHNPQRSFIRAWADENKAKHLGYLRKIGEAVLKGVYPATVGLERLGSLFVGEIQQRISAGIGPPLNQKTIKRKKSSVPLINTGQLRSAIRYVVKQGT